MRLLFSLCGLLLLASCDTAPGPLEYDLHHRWQLVRMTGGFAGVEIDALAEGIDEVLVFNAHAMDLALSLQHGRYEVWNDGQPMERGRFFIKEEATSSSRVGPVLYRTADQNGSVENRFMFSLEGDQLHLSAFCCDGFSYAYRRIRD